MKTYRNLTCALAVCIVGYVLLKGLPQLSWELLTTAPSYLKDTVGILPDLLNTLYLIPGGAQRQYCRIRRGSGGVYRFLHHVFSFQKRGDHRA